MDQTSKPRLQIVRGLPGSGKSSFVRSHWPHLMFCEFDQFAMRGGRFVIDDDPKTSERYRKQLDDTILFMLDRGLDFVVAGVYLNPQDQLEDLVNNAIKYGYDVWIHTQYGNYGNVHGVSVQEINRLAGMFQDHETLRKQLSAQVKYGVMPTGF